MKISTLKPYRVVSFLCACAVRPCVHLQLGDYAMLCYKSKRTREIIKKNFNFATFVRNLIACNARCRIKISCIKIAVKYGADVNQTDPTNGRNALHYTVYANGSWDSLSLCNYITHYVGALNVDAYDNSGLPPYAYSSFDLYGYSSTESKLRIKIKRKSEKLFQFLFCDVIPEHWSFYVLSIIDEMDLFNMPEDKRYYILHNARDEKGNTLLHIAAKTSNYNLTRKILQLYPYLQLIPNLKGKIPVQYCKYYHTFFLFNGNTWYKKFYFANRPLMNDGPFHSLARKFPQLLEIVNDKSMERVTIPNMDLIGSAISALNDETILLISRKVRDLAGNNVWHVYAKFFSDIAYNNDMKTLYEKFDKSLINDRNIDGNTPLHFAKQEYVRQLLIEFGAHQDCLNYKGELACNIMLNLQCIASRYVPVKHYSIVPKHLQSIVQLHQPLK